MALPCGGWDMSRSSFRADTSGKQRPNPALGLDSTFDRFEPRRMEQTKGVACPQLNLKLRAKAKGGRRPVPGTARFGKSESFRLCSISLITAASRINTFAGHGRLDVARYH
jgi:hypothetical protein